MPEERALWLRHVGGDAVQEWEAVGQIVEDIHSDFAGEGTVRGVCQVARGMEGGDF